MTEAKRTVDLDELERGAAIWERGEILASGVVSPTILRWLVAEIREHRKRRAQDLIEAQQREAHKVCRHGFRSCPECCT